MICREYNSCSHIIHNPRQVTHLTLPINMTTASASFLLQSSRISPNFYPTTFSKFLLPNSSAATETMKNCEKFQILMLSLIVILLIVTPLLSSSIRTTHLYIITNLLIISVGAQAGILRAFSKPIDHHEKQNQLSITQKPVLVAPSEIASTEITQKDISTQNENDRRVASEHSEKNVPNKMAVKSKSPKITGSVKTERVRKCPSMPSLFFIGGGETETEGALSHVNNNEVVQGFHSIEEEENVADLSGQELLIKAEKFIGNFYKQLKMQREESWKRIHGMYHKAF